MSVTADQNRAELLPTARTCARCGYDLRGQTVARCPECGLEFDPSDPLPAAVPWLHRNTLGSWRAFWGTVGMVLVHPKRLADEVARDGDVGLAESTQFRRLCALVAAGSVALTAELQLAPIGGTGMVHATTWLSVAIGTLMFVYLASIPIDVSGIEPAAGKIRFRRLHEFTCAPLAMTPVLPLLQFVGNGMRPLGDIIALLPVAGGIFILAAWLFAILRFQVQAAGRNALWVIVHLFLIVLLWALIAWFVAAMGLIIGMIIAAVLVGTWGAIAGA